MGMLIVTGASRGIGAAIARLAAARGYAVAVNYSRDAAAAEAVVREIAAAGGRALAIRADVAVEAEVKQLFATAEGELGPLRALVNNAGVAGKLGRLEALEYADLKRVVEVNLIGTILASRAALRRMSTRSGGSGGAIVNISSRAAQLGGANEWVHYAATKGAIETLTIGLAREAGSDGIRVNAVAPGLIETELHAAAGEPDRLERLRSGVPLQRAGTTSEVAEAVLWLLSPQASYVNGTILAVGGGR